MQPCKRRSCPGRSNKSTPRPPVGRAYSRSTSSALRDYKVTSQSVARTSEGLITHVDEYVVHTKMLFARHTANVFWNRTRTLIVSAVRKHDLDKGGSKLRPSERSVTLHTSNKVADMWLLRFWSNVPAEVDHLLYWLKIADECRAGYRKTPDVQIYLSGRILDTCGLAKLYIWSDGRLSRNHTKNIRTQYRACRAS